MAPHNIYQATSDKYDALDHVPIHWQYYGQYQEDHSVSISSQLLVPLPLICSASEKNNDYVNLTLDDIRTRDFIYYTNFKLYNDAHIMLFYRNVYTQG